MGTAERRYTLSEATAMLGPVAEVVGTAREARAVLVDEQLAERLAERAPGNGGGRDATHFATAALTFSRALGQLEAWGVLVRDLDSGLCDFPAEREGRPVYLCWQLGEDQIGFWHEVDDGFRGRRPVDDRTP
jgi:hypothetical protein